MKKNSNNVFSIGSFGASVMLLSAILTSSVYAYNTVDTQIDYGETNADVTNLQSFFKDNASIYPEGLVTGYYGSLSRTAVQRFQAAKGIVSSGSAATTGYGRVGPSTRDAINSLINSGGWSGSVSVSTDQSGSAFLYVNRSVSQNAVTFSWNTNELASAKVFYNTSPIYMNEGDINSVGFGSINGYSITNDNIARTSQQVTVSNLQSNTKYWYVIVATDVNGNVSVFDPNQTFYTNSY
jgi:peptidoglycan hydrolase-like protein with peptidoglycan-binding domain